MTQIVKLLIKDNQNNQHTFHLTPNHLLHAFRSPKLYIGDDKIAWFDSVKELSIDSDTENDNHNIIAVDFKNQMIYDHQSFKKLSVWRITDFVDNVSEIDFTCERLKNLQFLYERRMIPNMGIETICFPNMDNPDVFNLSQTPFLDFLEIVQGKNHHGFKFNDKQVEFLNAVTLDFQSGWRVREYGFEDKSKSIIRFKKDINGVGFLELQEVAV